MKTKTITRTALLFALSIVMAYLEHLIPPLPFTPPGIKLGLSNIITMYTLFFIGIPQALIIAVLKAGFVLMTRGTIAAILSLLGGLASVLIMALLSLPGRKDDSKKLTYLFLSICGAIFHNLGQLIGVYFMISHSFLAYVPVLIVSGILMGLITGSLLYLLLPALHHSFGIGQKGGA